MKRFFAICFVAGCGSSEVSPPGVPASQAARERAPKSVASATAVVAPVVTAKPRDEAPPIDGDAWVAKTFSVQRTYARVLAVGTKAASVKVAALDLNARGASAAGSEVAIAQTFATIQEAIDAARGGDLIAVFPGRYEGFSVHGVKGAGDGAFLHVLAVGAPGSVIIDRACREDAHWMVMLQRTHHVIVQGFTLEGAAKPAPTVNKGPWAGIFLDGDFAHSGELSHHLVIADVFAHDHVKWGLHATDTRTVLIQNSVFARSSEEHGAYVSDGSDEYVIRDNVFFGNHDAGLQCNVDPVASLHETLHHPAMKGIDRKGTTRAWAEDVLAKATAEFGAGNYPDGRGERFLIERNVMNQNGEGGGGALNLAGLVRSIVRENLLYDNHAHGIAAWDNGNPYDADRVKRGPEMVNGALELPLFGSADLVITHNTVLESAKGRAGLLLIHGSARATVDHNVVLNDGDSSVETDASSLPGAAFIENIFGKKLDFNSATDAQRGAATSAPGSKDRVGVLRAELTKELERAGDEPWILFAKGYWSLNPKRPDLKLKSRVAGQTSF